MPKTPEPAILQKIKYEELREALISDKINGRESLRFTAEGKPSFPICAA